MGRETLEELFSKQVSGLSGKGICREKKKRTAPSLLRLPPVVRPNNEENPDPNRVRIEKAKSQKKGGKKRGGDAKNKEMGRERVQEEWDALVVA